MPRESVGAVKVSSTWIVPSLVIAPVWPPRARTPVVWSRFWNSIRPLLVSELLLSMVTAVPAAGFTEPPTLMVMSPAVEVASGVVAPEPIVVWASAGAAQISAERLTIGAPNRQAKPRRRPETSGPEAFEMAAGEKYPVILKSHPPRPMIDRA